MNRSSIVMVNGKWISLWESGKSSNRQGSRRTLLSVCLCGFFLIASLPAQQRNGFQHPDWSPDGRLLVVSQLGNLWTFDREEKKWTQLTNGPVEDRDPSWTRNGRSLLFASNPSGSFHIWRMDLETHAAQALTHGDGNDVEPVSLDGGALLFTRGRGPERRLFRTGKAGQADRLTRGKREERSAAVSPDGERIVYVAGSGAGSRLRILNLESQEEEELEVSFQAAYPRWAPDGRRILFSSPRRRGIWVTRDDNAYVNLVSFEQAQSAWNSVTNRLILAGLPRPKPFYNGDPDRLPRDQLDLFPHRGELFTLAAPAALKAPEAALPSTPSSPELRMELFERAWIRLRDLYYHRPHNEARWKMLRKKYALRVARAASLAEVEGLVYDMLAERPTILQEAVSSRAAVSSAHPAATRAGIEILKAGGNVVDAAVAISFALGVVEPDASGVGGYGEMVLSLRSEEEPRVIEFLTRLPQAASLSNGRLFEQGGRLPRSGPRVVNVPGTVAGMYLAWKRHGSRKLPWKDLLQPAIRLAKEGFKLDSGIATTLFLNQNRYRESEAAKKLFFRDGRPLQAGDPYQNPNLAWVLEQIAEQGAGGFYRGEVARRMVEDLRRGGNLITLEDMAQYFAREGDPVTQNYRNTTIFSSVPAASGGASLISKLNILENRTPVGSGTALSSQELHFLIEAWKKQPSLRGKLADPNLWPVDLSDALSKEVGKIRFETINPKHAGTPSEVRALNGENRRENRRGGTTSFAVADSDGNMVSVTQTLGTWGGNFYVSPGLGFIYNDKLRSYSLRKGAYNSLVPFARNRTSISPTLVFKGVGADARPWLAVGAAGNAWINAAVYNIVVRLIDYKESIQQAVEAPRFLVSTEPVPAGSDGAGARQYYLQLENEFSPAVLKQLQDMGHHLQLITRPGEIRQGYASAVLVDLESGIVRAAADPRRSGYAAGLP